MIDEKGKLFGKINIIDLLVLLLIVLVAVVLAVKLLGPGKNAAAGKTKLTYTVLVESVQPEVYENIKQHIPDALMASGEVLDGQVVKVEAVAHPSNNNLVTEAGVIIIPQRDDLLDLTFTIECNIVNPITNEIGTQEVRIGKPHIVKTQHFELMNNGIITSCIWQDDAAA